MAIEWQQSSDAVSAGAQSTLTANYDFPVTPGNLLVARVALVHTGRTVTIPGWTHARPQNDRVATLMKFATSGDSQAVTVDVAGGATTIRMRIDEHHNVDTVTPVMAGSDNDGTSVTTLSSGTTSATTHAEGLALATFGMGGTIGEGTTLTNEFYNDSPLATQSMFASKFLTTTGAQETTATWVTARSVNAMIVVFKAATTGGTGVDATRRLALIEVIEHAVAEYGASGIELPEGHTLTSSDLAYLDSILVAQATGSKVVGLIVSRPALSTQTDRLVLSWDPITVVTGVTYDVERNGVVVATGLTSTAYTDTGLQPNTTYSYRVRAVA